MASTTAKRQTEKVISRDGKYCIPLPSNIHPEFTWGAAITVEGKAGKIEGLNWVEGAWDYQVRFFDGTWRVVAEHEITPR